MTGKGAKLRAFHVLASIKDDRVSNMKEESILHETGTNPRICKSLPA